MVERFLQELDDEEERRVADYMSTLASATAASMARLPAGDAVWVKAQLLRRWEAERQAQRPLDAMEPVQFGLGLVAAVVLFVWSAPVLMRSLEFLQR
jgi:hypothetical protein